jgi:hypothetical protein
VGEGKGGEGIGVKRFKLEDNREHRVVPGGR